MVVSVIARVRPACEQLTREKWMRRKGEAKRDEVEEMEEGTWHLDPPRSCRGDAGKKATEIRDGVRAGVSQAVSSVLQVMR